MVDEILEVAIIGGGPAGLAAALSFGRSLIKVIIISAENPRNLVTEHMHNFLSRDGISPKEFISISKQQLDQYNTVSYTSDFVIDVEKEIDCYKIVTLNNKVYFSKKIIFAVGCKDDIPSIGIKGLQDVYGKSVFPCPLCDGWERRGQRLAVFGSSNDIVHYTKIISNWTDDLILFTNGYSQISDTDKQLLIRNNVLIFESPINYLQSNSGQLEAVVLSDGQSIERQGGFIMDTHETPASKLPIKLGVKTYFDEEQNKELYEADLFGSTDIKDVYIIGDAKDGYIGQFASAFEGSHCAKMIMYSIIEERWSIK